jgi:putative transposase
MKAAYWEGGTEARSFCNGVEPGSEQVAELVAKLREVDFLLARGKTVSQAVEIIGVSARTYRRWRLRFGRLALGDERLLRVLEAENIRLRKTVTDLAIQTVTLRENLERG